MSAQPDSRVHAWPRAVGVLIWSTYVLVLAATYVVAGHRGDRTTQQVAAWGLSVAVALAILGLPLLAMAIRRRPHDRRPRRPRWWRVTPAGKGTSVLLRSGWEQRLAEADLAVALEAGFWADARRSLDPRAYEQGGVALTVRTPKTVLVLGAVFPAQVRANAVACQFPAAEVDRVRHALNAVGPSIGVLPGMITVTWVHTHPQLGVFLSGTDHATARKWRGLDPHFTPIVIDISQGELSRAIGVFDGHGRKIQPMSTTAGLVDPGALARLRAALAGAYPAGGAEAPLILLGDAVPMGGEPRADRR